VTRPFSTAITLLVVVGTGWGIAVDGAWSDARYLLALAAAGVAVAELGRLVVGGRLVAGRVQWGLSIWPFAAAMLVPPLLVGLVAVPVYLCERYRGPRIPEWRWVTSGAVVTVAAWAAGSVFRLATGTSLPATGSAAQLGGMAAALLTYLAVEVLLFFMLGRSDLTGESFLRDRLSSSDFYLSEVGVLATGATIAVVCRYWLGFLILTIPMAVVLQRAWLYVPYKRRALRDSSTQLLNYQAWRQAAIGAVRRERADGCGYAVVFLDLDYFKAVNDGYGHAMGDEVLLKVADVLRQVTRRPDLAGRYGGEEFCVLLPGVDVDQAVEVAERLRTAVAALQFSSERLSVTASFGVACQAPSGRPKGEAAIDDLVVHADQALYAAKESGRDRVCVWSPDM
jgi:diguanylate cyclase (GGDEF)-like protein